ncbi:MAG: Pycsar system effector family protein [Leeuwenhoekiella sp.]
MRDEPEDANLFPPVPKSGHTEELVDHYWGSINYVFSLIRASEIKAGLILSFYGILLNFTYQQLEVFLEAASTQVLLYLPLVLWVLATAASIYFCVRCFMPRIEGKFDKNVFFFKDVITKFGDIKTFSSTFYKISLDERELFDQLGQQIYINSKIAALKFKFVNRAIRMLAVSLGLLFILIITFSII